MADINIRDNIRDFFGGKHKAKNPATIVDELKKTPFVAPPAKTKLYPKCKKKNSTIKEYHETYGKVPEWMWLYITEGCECKVCRKKN